MSALFPENQPMLMPTLNVVQWELGLQKYHELQHDVTVWETAEYQFSVVNRDGIPHFRCFWKYMGQELYCNPAVSRQT